jgi:hypothetical protein
VSDARPSREGRRNEGIKEVVLPYTNRDLLHAEFCFFIVIFISISLCTSSDVVVVQLVQDKRKYMR